MDQITILGSTGFVGKVLINHALEKGFRVKTLVRNPYKLDMIKDKVEIIQGDIFQRQKIDESIKGSIAVLSTVPPEGNTKKPEKYENAMKILIESMEKNGIHRFIHIGGAAVDGGMDERWSVGRRMLRSFLNIVWKGGLQAKLLEWNVLKESRIDWTLIRPPRIRAGNNGKIMADEKKLTKVEVYVDDLVEFMLAQIDSKEWIKKAPLVSSF
jgi:putative NADH-flavin reductase